MDDMGKLLHLAGHWGEHNSEHERSYLDWASRAEAEGKAGAAGALREMALKSREMEPLIRKLRESLGG